jgi:superoxide reductase
MNCEDDIFCGINQPKSEKVDAMSDLEKKHIPVIEAPSKVRKGEPFEVTVEVGKHLKHPNENAHYIEWIELFSGDTFLARIDLIPRMTEPKVKLVIALDHAHPLVAKERCNLHGQWQSFPFEIEVEE